MLKEDFYNFQAQTTAYSLGIEVDYAKGSWIYEKNGKAYLDMVAGVSVCNIGHSHPQIIRALKKQAKKHLHVMVYGETIQKEAVKLCKKLSELTDGVLDMVYLTNSGTEAIEGAIKLAKRITNRTQLISCKNAYHGATHGSLSLSGNEKLKKNYYPFLPDVDFIEFNNVATLDKITTKTAAVFLETIQGSAGFITPSKEFFRELQNKCKQTGTLICLDEIQTGFGRTGKIFGYQNFEITPDIIVVGKALAAGLPIGGFMAKRENMLLFTKEPMLGHITTFGGQSLSACTANAHLKFLEKEKTLNKIEEKEKLIRQNIIHPKIKSVDGMGLMLAAKMVDDIDVNMIIKDCIKEGVLFFNLLFDTTAIRITPPLTIKGKDILHACEVLKKVLDKY